MNPQHLSILACPETGAPLELSVQQASAAGMVVSGALTSPQGRSYPIIRGVPRFVREEQYTNSFGYEWNRWPRLQFDDENVGRPFAGHTTRMWEKITAANEIDVRGKTIVEFGCGPGRFLDVVRRKGGCAVGIDMSLAVDAARRNFPDDPEVLVVQGDILQPPFRASAFAAGYSIGVLHHTPEPAAGLRRMAQCIAAGGWVAICVYPKGEFYDYRSVARFRRWHQRLSPRCGYRPALAYSYLAAYCLAPTFRKLRKIPGAKPLLRWLEREYIVNLDLPDVRWRVLDIFDAITPETASTHTSEEVREWLELSGCVGIRPTPWCCTSFAASASSATSRAA